MADREEDEFQDDLEHQEYQGVSIFNLDGEEEDGGERPAKRRKTSKKSSSTIAADASEPPQDEAWDDGDDESCFVKLLDGKEDIELVRMRASLFRKQWRKIEKRVKRILRDANRATLDGVKTFVQSTETLSSKDKLPSSFIITGPNIASQDLLFEQLQESLTESSTAANKFVRLRSADATNLKATLGKIVKDVTAPPDEDDEQVSVTLSGRKYLNYDLEALHEYITAQGNCEHVFIAFQDSEGFDSSLLSDLIVLFSNWRPQIPFTLLFGVATSVELLQARLLKSACEYLHGAQFDVVQGDLVLERVIKRAVAAADVPLRIGPTLLNNLVGRQDEQVAGIQVFISSLKYAYMCHFYANPLSVCISFAEGPKMLQQEHCEGLSSLPSFRESVEKALSQDHNPELARSLLKEADDAQILGDKIRDTLQDRDNWILSLLRSVKIASIVSPKKASFIGVYIDAMANGINPTPDDPMFDSLRKMESKKMIAAMRSIRETFDQGDEDLGLPPGPNIPRHAKAIERLLSKAESLLAAAENKGEVLRSKYSGQTKVARTTVIAQKVQLSHDSATLTDEDSAFTKVVDEFVELVNLEASTPALKGSVFHEIWSYDSKAPYRDVFVPRPRGVFERGLARPQDYLGCSCCNGSEDASALAPATCLLYRLYQECGGLINVADLWSAFYGIVGDNDEEDGGRLALLQFYRGLAELKCLGFVKSSKKKADHVAKLKWL